MDRLLYFGDHESLGLRSLYYRQYLKPLSEKARRAGNDHLSRRKGVVDIHKLSDYNGWIVPRTLEGVKEAGSRTTSCKAGTPLKYMAKMIIFRC